MFSATLYTITVAYIQAVAQDARAFSLAKMVECSIDNFTSLNNLLKDWLHSQQFMELGR